MENNTIPENKESVQRSKDIKKHALSTGLHIIFQIVLEHPCYKRQRIIGSTSSDGEHRD